MRTISAVTVARSDYGIYLPVLRQIQAEPGLRLGLLVSGMHLSPEFGLTVKTIETDGFEIIDRVEMLVSSDSPEGIAKSIGLGTIGFAQAFSHSRPDLLLVLGDRFEMFAAVLAALPFKIPVAHIHGGEVTEGAIDDALRHSITKLSHLHFVSLPEYARRVEQLGEEPWRITVSGAVSLDNLREIPLLTPAELENRFALRLEPPPLLVTFHPVTLEYERTTHHIEELLAALDEVALPVVFTLPNADTSGRIIRERISDHVQRSPATYMVENLGTQGYFSLMSCAAAMVGNSSSGIIEAPSFKLPVVNIGSRQTGRVRAANVIDVGYERSEIAKAVRRAVSTDFRARLQTLANPYEKGGAAEAIVSRLKAEELNERLVCKVFHDLSGAG
jgi:UDP-hydrolysing UDP-N-acetyl-D-glucosamine 2-epimerase